MTPEPESSSGERKRSRPATRREVRPSLQRWSERFDQVLMARTQTAKILDEEGFWGLPVGFVKGALWVYYCGPGEEVVSRSLKSSLGKGSLCERMNTVADELDRIVRDFGTPLLTCLNEMDKSTSGVKKLTKRDLSDVAKTLPAELRVYAGVLRTLSGTPLLIPHAGRNTAASRALVWLFLAIKTFSKRSANKTYAFLGELLEIGSAATGKPETIVTADRIRARILRFKNNQPDEFAWIRKYWGNTMIPPSASDFLLLITFGPAFPRAMQT